MKKISLIFLVLMWLSYSVQGQESVITGTVKDINGTPLPGVEIYLPGSNKNIASSDTSGNIRIIGLPENVTSLYFTSPNPIPSQGYISLDENNFELVITKDYYEISRGYGLTTNNRSNTASISAITYSELRQFSEVNLAKALYGKLPGLSVMQSGDPNLLSQPELLIRGRSTFGNNDPLILVDGFERGLQYVSIATVESVTVLKDAAATALYGIRGANGVILITTKSGEKGKTKVNVDYRSNTYMPFRLPEMADAADYANAYNEALINDGQLARFSSDEIEAFRSGKYEYAYPDVDWNKQIFKDFSTNHQFDITASGGREHFKYFSAITYSNAQGLFKKSGLTQREDHELSKLHFDIRSNMDVNITESTLIEVGLFARLSEQNQPGNGINLITSSMQNIPAAAFPVYSPEGGFASTQFYNRNPVAMVNFSGFDKFIEQSLFSDIRLKQNLSRIAAGLSAEAAISLDFNSMLNEMGNRSYSYKDISSEMDEVGNVTTTITSFGEDTPMTYGDNLENQFINHNLEGSINYNRNMNDINFFGTMLYDHSWYFGQGRNNTDKTQSLKTLASIGYKDKYMIDAILNFSGSSVLPEGERMRAFPAISAGWIVSSEDFMQQALVNYMKIRASYGLNGSYYFGHELYKQFYTGGGNYFFTNNVTSFSGAHEGTLPVFNLGYEIVRKSNLGIDMRLLKNHFNMSVDLFYEYRDQILITANMVISSVIGVDIAQQMDGEVENKGLELLAGYRKSSGDFEFEISGNFTFARNKIIENNEGFVPYNYLSRKGNSLGANYGLEAMGFFDSEEDIANSPLQTFSEVKPGDIKYKDQNNDNKIDENDIIHFGHSGGTPEIYYGMHLHLGYKSVGVNIQLQGVGNRTIYTSTPNIFFPLRNGTNISDYYLNEKTRWTETTKELADMPRLTAEQNENNFRPSTQWFINGNYLKIRNIELYYNLPARNLITADATVFVRGANLFSLDNLKNFDPENYGIFYPSLSSFTIGANINF